MVILILSVGVLLTSVTLGFYTYRKRRLDFARWPITIQPEQMGKRTFAYLKSLGVTSIYWNDNEFNLLIPGGQFLPRRAPIMVAYRPAHIPPREIKFRHIAASILESYSDSKAVIVVRGKVSPTDYHYGQEFSIGVLDVLGLSLFCDALLCLKEGRTQLPDGLPTQVLDILMPR